MKKNKKDPLNVEEYVKRKTLEMENLWRSKEKDLEEEREKRDKIYEKVRSIYEEVEEKEKRYEKTRSIYSELYDQLIKKLTENKNKPISYIV